MAFDLNMKGTCKWAKVQEPVENYDKTGMEYTIDFYPNEQGLKDFEESGLSLKQKEDEDGVFIKFKRPVSKVINNEEIFLGKPKIVDSKGKELNSLVGNGSSVTVKIKVYDTRVGKGHQFEGMKVHELVEYNPQEPIGVESPF